MKALFFYKCSSLDKCHIGWNIARGYHTYTHTIQQLKMNFSDTYMMIQGENLPTMGESEWENPHLQNSKAT